MSLVKGLDTDIAEFIQDRPALFAAMEACFKNTLKTFNWDLIGKILCAFG